MQLSRFVTATKTCPNYKKRQRYLLEQSPPLIFMSWDPLLSVSSFALRPACKFVFLPPETNKQNIFGHWYVLTFWISTDFRPKHESLKVHLFGNPGCVLLTETFHSNYFEKMNCPVCSRLLVVLFFSRRY